MSGQTKQRTPCGGCGQRERAIGLSVCESCARGLYGRHRTELVPKEAK
jgi:hypothetical protein